MEVTLVSYWSVLLFDILAGNSDRKVKTGSCKLSVFVSLPSMALLSAEQSDSLCVGSSCWPTGQFHGSEYANRLNASYKVRKTDYTMNTVQHCRAYSPHHIMTLELICLYMYYHFCPLVVTKIKMIIITFWNVKNLTENSAVQFPRDSCFQSGCLEIRGHTLQLLVAEPSPVQWRTETTGPVVER